MNVHAVLTGCQFPVTSFSNNFITAKREKNLLRGKCNRTTKCVTVITNYSWNGTFYLKRKWECNKADRIHNGL